MRFWLDGGTEFWVVEDFSVVGTDVGCSEDCDSWRLLEESVHPAVMSIRDRQMMMPMT